MTAVEICPCGTGKTYKVCCGQIHSGVLAVTPEQLMRSRYSAFALGLESYLNQSWAERTRPAELELDPVQKWTRLRILDVPEPVGNSGTVHFRAHYRYQGERDFLEERSRFERVDGVWLYVDGDVL